MMTLRATLAWFEKDACGAINTISIAGALLTVALVLSVRWPVGGPLRLELRDFAENIRATGAGPRGPSGMRSGRSACGHRALPVGSRRAGDLGNGNPPNTGMGLPRCRRPGRDSITADRLLPRQSVADEARQVVARIDWLDSQGRRVGQPDYAYETSATGTDARDAARAGAAAGPCARGLSSASAGPRWGPCGGTIVTFEEAQPPPARWVRVGTVSLHPRNNRTPGRLPAGARPDREGQADIVCLARRCSLRAVRGRTSAPRRRSPGQHGALGREGPQYGMYIVAGSPSGRCGVY